jgi:hypothetical protein
VASATLGDLSDEAGIAVELPFILTVKQMAPLGVSGHVCNLCRYDLLRGFLMSALQKVLVVDNGERASDIALSAELAGMGYASVTAPFEAADDVLALMPSPVAVVLQMPRSADWSERRRFLELASRLRKSMASNSIPVIITGGISGAAAMLQSELGARAVAAPEL